MSSPLVHAFASAGSVGKFIMITLFVMSIVAWGVIAKKLKDFRDHKRNTLSFLSIFRRNAHDLFSIKGNLNTPCPLLAIFKAGMNHLGELLHGLDPYYVEEIPGAAGQQPAVAQVAQVARTRASLGKREIELLEGTLERSVTDQLMKLDQYLIFLATTSAAGPLLGLLGTVWGIMMAFRQMGVHGNASISVVAPGISEALITTAAGLIVAIPALVAYNFLVNQIKSEATQMENFAGEFVARVKQKYLAE